MLENGGRYDAEDLGSETKDRPSARRPNTQSNAIFPNQKADALRGNVPPLLRRSQKQE